MIPTVSSGKELEKREERIKRLNYTKDNVKEIRLK